MRLRHIIAATDASAEGNHAVQVAQRLGQVAGARVTPVMVHFPVPLAMLPARPATVPSDLPAGTIIAEGIPAIEIIRLAEAEGADLVVLSRSLRPHVNPLTLGDTCDAVIRRAEVPCLVVPPEQDRFGRMTAALDGSERGLAVLREAWRLRRLTGDGLSALFVEPPAPDDASRLAATPSPQVEFLERSLHRVLPPEVTVPLIVRQGEVVPQVLEGLSAIGGDLLVVGVRRGGPAGMEESTGSGRRILAAAPCAVMTVPL